MDGNPHSEATGLMQRQRLTARATGKILDLAPANKSLSAFRSVAFHVSFACKASSAIFRRHHLRITINEVTIRENAAVLVRNHRHR